MASSPFISSTSLLTLVICHLASRSLRGYNYQHPGRCNEAGLADVSTQLEHKSRNVAMAIDNGLCITSLAFPILLPVLECEGRNTADLLDLRPILRCLVRHLDFCLLRFELVLWPWL